MKISKKIFFTSIAITAIMAFAGCSANVTVMDEDSEYKEKYENLVSDIEEEAQEYANQTYVDATAKKIFTGFSSYLVQVSITGETISSSETYDSLKEKLYNAGYLPQDIYMNDDIYVEWDYSNETYSVKFVKVKCGEYTGIYD